MKNMNLINKMAWSFNATTGIDFEELKSEAVLAYYEAMTKFNPEMGVKETTFAYHCMKNHLRAFIGRELERKECFAPEEAGMTVGSISPYQFELADFVNPVRDVIDIVLENADRFDGPPKNMRGQVVKLLREHGYSWSEVWDGIRETKEAISNY